MIRKRLPVLLPDRSGWTFPDGRTIRIFSRSNHPKAAHTHLLAWIETPSLGLAEWRGLRYQPDNWNEWARCESREPGKHLDALAMTPTGLSIVNGRPCLRTGETLADAASGTVPPWMPTPHPEETLLLMAANGKRPTAAQRKAANGKQDTDLPTVKQRAPRNEAFENRFAVLTAILNCWKRTAPAAPSILQVANHAMELRPTLTRKRIGQILTDIGFDWLPADDPWARDRLAAP